MYKRQLYICANLVHVKFAMQNLSRISMPIPVLSSSAWVLRQRSSGINVPIFSMFSSVVDVESLSGRGSSLVVSRPLNV